MAFSKKTWKDRISQYINRRLLTDSDGNTQQVTVTRDEGSVTEAGDAFSASNMNDLEDRIDAAFDGLTAADIPYSSGVSVADKLDDITGLLKIVVSGNISKTLTSGQLTGILGNEVIAAADMPSGYTPIGLLASYCTNQNVRLFSYDAATVGTTGTFCFLYNQATTNQSVIFNFRVVFAKSGYVS